MLPDLYNKYDLLHFVGLTKEQFDQMDDEEVARLFMYVGWRTDTVTKNKEAAIGLYWIGMQSAMKAGWEPHKWATLFERVLIILRKKKNYETELKVLDEIIPRFEYLAKYHKWEQRRMKLKALMQKKSTIKGLLRSLMNIFP